MKRALVCAVLCAAVALGGLAGCGSSGGGSTTAVAAAGGYLPGKIEQIQQGGIVPAGYEAKKALADSIYPEESLYGEWVRVYAADEEQPEYAPDAEVVEYRFYNESGVETAERHGCFPKSMSFYPAGYSQYTSGMNLYYLQRDAEDTGMVSVELSSFAQIEKALGYGEGSVSLQNAQQGSPDGFGLVGFDVGGSRVVYAFSGDTLVLGYLDEGGYDDSAMTETHLFELDYGVSMAGYSLTLTYGGQTATYAPKCIVEDQKIELSQAGLSDGAAALDDILGITLDSSAGMGQVMYEPHDGYVDAAMSFSADGSCTIADKAYNYIYSGNTLVLQSEAGQAAYNVYCPAVKSPNITETSAFVVNGTEIAYNRDTVQRLVERGLQTNLDLNQLIDSCQVTSEFTMALGSAQIKVCAANPYQKAAPLADCLVCSIELDSSMGDIQKTGIFSSQTVQVGTTPYKTVEFLRSVPYEKKPHLLRYKTIGNGHISITEGAQTAYGDYALKPDNNADVTYEFGENDILQKIRIEVPTLLYKGLQDNAPLDTLAAMDTSTLQGVMQIRDTVLDRLKKAFDSAGVSVSVDETSGEVTMDSTVLFGFDSYELTDEGKEYLDSFISVYASVLLDDSLGNAVTGISFEGHTDSSGSYYYNQTLSEKRAEAVRQQCLASAAAGLTAEQNTRLEQIATATGYSCSDPVYNENGSEDAAASRRVAIKFYVAG